MRDQDYIEMVQNECRSETCKSNEEWQNHSLYKVIKVVSKVLRKVVDGICGVMNFIFVSPPYHDKIEEVRLKAMQFRGTQF